jgi:hypothetical protein
MTILQSELDKVLTEARTSSAVPKPKAPLGRKFPKYSALYTKKFSDSSCVITQDELDQTLVDKRR